VAIRITLTALPITSAGRLSPFGPLGIPAKLLLGGKHITEMETLPMSMADLHDLAKKLHDHRETQRSHSFPGSNEEIKLIADAFLQAVREIANLERRVAALEGKPQSN
jgi:hypothetical protein